MNNFEVNYIESKHNNLNNKNVIGKFEDVLHFEISTIKINLAKNIDNSNLIIKFSNDINGNEIIKILTIPLNDDNNFLSVFTFGKYIKLEIDNHKDNDIEINTSFSCKLTDVNRNNIAPNCYDFVINENDELPSYELFVNNDLHSYDNVMNNKLKKLYFLYIFFK